MEERLKGLAVGMVGAAAVALLFEEEGHEQAKQAVSVLLFFGIQWPPKENVTESMQVDVEELCTSYRVLGHDAEALKDVWAALRLPIGIKSVGMATELKSPGHGCFGRAEVDHSGVWAKEDVDREDLAAEAKERLGGANNAGSGGLHGA